MINIVAGVIFAIFSSIIQNILNHRTLTVMHKPNKQISTSSLLLIELNIDRRGASTLFMLICPLPKNNNSGRQSQSK